MLQQVRSSIWNYFFFTKNKASLRFFHTFLLKRLNTSETAHYINKPKNLLFIHNPKAAGNTIKSIFGLNRKHTTHIIPSLHFSKKCWEEHFVIAAVRHPIDRFFSSYHYHTQEKYQGYYYKQYPQLHQLSPAEYFDIMSKEAFAIRPQSAYCQHYLSDKKIDFIIRFEHLEEDLKTCCQKINMPFEGLPHLNPSKKNKKVTPYLKDKVLMKKLEDFYKEDFEQFGYEMY